MLALALLAVAATPRQDAPVDGEYGLFVQLPRDSLVVQWLTADTTPGVLEASWDGAATRHLATAAATTHRAAIPRPRADQVLIRYGAAGSALAETRLYLADPRRDPVEFPALDSLYILGDTHGDYDGVVGALRAAGLVDAQLRWIGGKHRLVFAGDLVDRGRDVTRLLWFVYRLEREAAAAGGRIHVLLGNHEIMNMTGDLRYLHEREAALAEAHGVSYDRMVHVRESLLGRWLASKPGAIRIGGVLIAHGGIATDWKALSLRRLDAMLATFLAPEVLYRDPATARTRADSVRLQAREDFFWHPHSLFWYRDFVLSDNFDAQLDSVLHSFGAQIMVVGHTQLPTMQARYGGKLIAAHTVRYGGDVLLLVRERGRYRHIMIGEQGTFQTF